MYQMSTDLLEQLEQKVSHAVDIIEILRMQVEELEEENLALKNEQNKWRKDLQGLIQRFDDILRAPMVEPVSEEASV